jgi:hypothetical protein
VPQILSIKPNSCFQDEEAMVNISFYYPGTVGRSAFCRFGSVFVRAQSITNSTIQCRAPLRAPQVVNFAVSFDSTLWSKEDFRFTFKEYWRGRLIINVSVYLTMSLILLLLIGFAFCRKKSRVGKVTKEEGAPFLPGKRSKGVAFSRRKLQIEELWCFERNIFCGHSKLCDFLFWFSDSVLFGRKRKRMRALKSFLRWIIWWFERKGFL